MKFQFENAKEMIEMAQIRIIGDKQVWFDGEEMNIEAENVEVKKNGKWVRIEEEGVKDSSFLDLLQKYIR